MISVKVAMRSTGEPLKRTPVVLMLDPDGRPAGPMLTDRSGVAQFDIPDGSGRILVSGVERYQGRLAGVIPLELWSITQSEHGSAGAPGEFPAGSNAYPDMTTRSLDVDGRAVLTDSEGYLVDPGDWSEGFVRAQAGHEGLALAAEHWELIRFLREHYARYGHQASVRDMIRHFRAIWGAERGSSRHLHRLFPRGGPQKQGNRLAGLLRTKGEH
jgi:tRNA 2-thiouridine synthesizing protein E